MKSSGQHPESVPAVIERIIRVQLSLELPPSVFADRAGIGRSTYSNWRAGTSRPELNQAMKLCDTYGLTLDYIYRGKLECLSARILDALAAHKKRQAEAKKTIEHISFPKGRR